MLQPFFADEVSGSGVSIRTLVAKRSLEIVLYRTPPPFRIYHRLLWSRREEVFATPKCKLLYSAGDR